MVGRPMRSDSNPDLIFKMKKSQILGKGWQMSVYEYKLFFSPNFNFFQKKKLC